MNASKKNSQFIKKVLKEADEEDAQPVDKIALIQDLADIEANLSDSFARLYQYKGQYIENDEWRSSLTTLRSGISTILNSVAKTMSMIGLEDTNRPTTEI